MWGHCTEITSYLAISDFESLGRFLVGGKKILYYECFYLCGDMHFMENKK
jgi:hypothetical protein